MEIVIAAAVLAAGLVVAALLLVKRAPGSPRAGTAPRRPGPRARRPSRDGREGRADARSSAAQEIGRLEERLVVARGGARRARSAELDAARGAPASSDSRRPLRPTSATCASSSASPGCSAGQAKQLLLKELEDQIRHDAARLVRQIEEETKRDAERRVRNILAVVMQRLAAGHAAETTVSVVQLPADDMKGRIIGREGRNIRALEHLTGVDFIIDDTPSAVILSGFDGVRREIARMTLEKLLQDGRIHPARIEETYYQAKSELESHIVESGEQAALRRQRPGPRPRAGPHPRPPASTAPATARTCSRTRSSAPTSRR